MNRTRALGGLLILLLVAVGGWLALPDGDGTPASDVPSGVLGDTDGDGTVAGDEKDDLARTERSLALLESSVFPTTDTVTRLLTPAGEDWWDLATSLAAETYVHRASAPAASWLAVSEQAASRSSHPTLRSYTALHVGFPDATAALAWAEQAAAEAERPVPLRVRGAVVTVTPPWVDPGREPYPEVPASLGEAVEVPVALWQSDLGAQVRLQARDTPQPKTYRQVWAHWGVGGDATWSATSPTAAGPWRGRLDGFDAKAVDVHQAGRLINRATLPCPPGAPRGCAAGPGMSEMIYESYAAQPNGRTAGDEQWRPREAPGDAALVLGLSTGFRGAASVTTERHYPPMSSLGLWVLGDGDLWVAPAFGPPVVTG